MPDATVWLLWKQEFIHAPTTTMRRRPPRTGPGHFDGDEPEFEQVNTTVSARTEKLVGVYDEDPLAGRTPIAGLRSECKPVITPERVYVGEGI